MSAGAVPDELEPLLAAAFAQARAAWPGVAVTAERFASAVARRLTDGTAVALAALRTDDVYLAAACVDRDPAALVAFDRMCVPVIDRAVGAAGATPAETADLRQVVRQRLLVPAETESGESEPRLATYSGRGSLASWIRVVATREAKRLLPRERRVVVDEDGLSALVAPDDDPEIGYLKRLYRAEFKVAFTAAVAALSDRERMLLQQHALDGLSIDELAAFYRVHRATTARWVEAARQAVLDGTRRELIRRLQLSRDELDSIMRLIRSQLDVSLPALLRQR